MKRMMAALLLMGCNEEQLPKLIDTGWFEDDGVDWSECPERAVATEPADGELGWFYRDAPQILLGAPSPNLEVRLTSAIGRVVPTTLKPEDSGLRVAVSLDEDALEADTDYILEYADCDGPHEITFTTSEVGKPLTVPPATLQGGTYHLDIQAGRWIEPGGFGAVLSASFESEILIGVSFSSDEFIDLLGGQGYFFVGDLRQDTGQTTWDFPLTDFSGHPYFETTADVIELKVSGYPLPISDFWLSGTFAPDGNSIVSATLRGLGDTRFAGGALGQPQNESAFCELGAAAGVNCSACPDGEELCLAVEIDQILAPRVEDLVMVPVVE